MVVDSFQLQNSLPRMGMQQVTVRDIATRLEEKLNTVSCSHQLSLRGEGGDEILASVVLMLNVGVSSIIVEVCCLEIFML